MTDIQHCPDPERIAAFVRGDLAENESMMTAIHCFDCAECRQSVARTRARLTEPAESRVLKFALGGAMALGLAVLSRGPSFTTNRQPILRLVQASALTDRAIEPRLTGGFQWAPLRAFKRGTEAGGTPLFLSAAAAEILQIFQDDRSPQSRHAAALAHMVVGDADRAASVLEPVADAAADAKIWSDVAAARYVTAVREDEPFQLARALAAVDAALRLDPQMAEAHFNRALILERLGLREQARQEWDAYLRVDAGSDWGNEARQHFSRLRPTPLFQDELERDYDRLTTEPARAHALARRYRQDARLWGETEILARWASAERGGNHDLAGRHLSLARELGEELARDRGDQMLRSLVAAIDRAEDRQRGDLVTAHLAFRDGQHAYKRNQPARAEQMLIGAAEAFEHGGSPGTFLARYFAANTLYSLGRIEESGKKIEQLIVATPPEFTAHRAQLLWQIGLVHLARSRWGKCIDALTESATIFERLDEKRYASIVRSTLATSYDHIGNPSESWKQRTIALREIGQRTTPSLLTALTLSSHSAASNGDQPAANSLLGLAIDVARRVDDPFVEASTHFVRAHLDLRTNDREAARNDLEEARAATARVTDPGYRSLLETHAVTVEALLATSAETTVSLLTRAIEFHSTRGRRALLPELLLERGRAFRRMRDDEHAAVDFETGISELEAGRETLPGGPDRFGVFHDAGDLFHEAITLSLENRDSVRAFEYAERARARALLDALGAAWPSVQPQDVPEGSVIVEYAVNAKETVIFVVDRQGVRAVRQSVDRSRLTAEVAELTQAAMKLDASHLRSAGRALYRRLIEPIETELTGKDTIVVVPDPKLGNLPFAALVDEGGRFLIESHSIAVSPSAAAFTRLSRMPHSASGRQVLVVTGAEDLGPLSAAEHEAASVASVYPRVMRLARRDATPAAFAREAATADVIHFAGHSLASSSGGRYGYLLLARGDSTDGQLDLQEIASMRLRRTSVVVLAACSTAAGEIQSTEGTISVARAFLAAGVPSVVATLWPIDDEQAADFFPVVHRYMARGLSPAEALRAAQLEWIRKPDATAALWAAAQLIGK